MGGAVAFHLAYYALQQNIHVSGIIVENTFLSISAMVDKLMPFLVPIKRFVLRLNWDSTMLVPHLTQPILFLAGSKDELVPHEHMQHLMLIASSSSYKQFHVIDGGTHNESWIQGGAVYWSAIGHFVKQALQARGQEISSFSPPSGMEAFANFGDAATIPTMSNHYGDILMGNAINAPPAATKKER